MLQKMSAWSDYFGKKKKILNWDTHVTITTLSTWGETCVDLLPLQSRRPWFLTFLSWRKLHIHPRVCGPTRTWSWPGTWDWRSRHIPAPSAQVRRNCNTAPSPLPETNKTCVHRVNDITTMTHFHFHSVWNRVCLTATVVKVALSHDEVGNEMTIAGLCVCADQRVEWHQCGWEAAGIHIKRGKQNGDFQSPLFSHFCLRTNRWTIYVVLIDTR